MTPRAVAVETFALAVGLVVLLIVNHYTGWVF